MIGINRRERKDKGNRSLLSGDIASPLKNFLSLIHKLGKVRYLNTDARQQARKEDTFSHIISFQFNKMIEHKSHQWNVKSFFFSEIATKELKEKHFH